MVLGSPYPCYISTGLRKIGLFEPMWAPGQFSHPLIMRSRTSVMNIFPGSNESIVTWLSHLVKKTRICSVLNGAWFRAYSSNKTVENSQPEKVCKLYIIFLISLIDTFYLSVTLVQTYKPAIQYTLKPNNWSLVTKISNANIHKNNIRVDMRDASSEWTW